VHNPEDHEEFYVVHTHECKLEDGSSSRTDDVLIPEWQRDPDPHQLIPRYTLASSLHIVKVSALCVSYYTVDYTL
jgi:hypothetical protein